jgi:hypothetical protein
MKPILVTSVNGPLIGLVHRRNMAIRTGVKLPLAFTAAIPAANAFVHRNPPALNMLCQVCP